MASQPNPFVSEAEYLTNEINAGHKSQYFRGEVFVLGSANREHQLICGNAIALLGNQLRDTDCEVYPSDMKVNVVASGLYTYPDVSVACENPKFLDEHGDVLLNPRVLIEVLSDSTEAYDRGMKFERCRQLPSLQEYLLIAQKRVHAELYSRQATGSWLLTEYSQLDQEVELKSINCRLPLVELYQKVTFTNDDA